MAAESHPALETQQEMLADRLDALEHASVENTRDACGPAAWMRALGLDPISYERLELRRCSMKNIAFWHAVRPPARTRAREAR
jgi:hypothetical protein